jgi:hypothetical protein
MLDLRNNESARTFTCEINGTPVLAVAASGGSPDESSQGEGTSGQLSIDEVTITNYVRPDVRVWQESVQKLLRGEAKPRFTIVICVLDRHGECVRKLVYENCLLTSLDFPRIDSAGGELLVETSTWKPETLTVS